MDDIVVESSSIGFSYMTIVWIVIGLLLLVLLIVVFVRIKKLLTKPEMEGLSREEIAKRWIMIRQTSQQGLMGAKLAIMEADTLLDSALKSMSMPGQNLGERLRFAIYKYPKLQRVWGAHRLRNQLVHEVSFQLSSHQAKEALDEFEKALKIMNIL